jgi:XRE family transcriptional regulator, regulator of sulfur utilization
MSDVLKVVGNNIKTYRESKGLTQVELADLSELHRNYIVAVEKGERNLSILSLQKIADALKIDIQRLFDEEIQQEL